jgi:hypothetical protein
MKARVQGYPRHYHRRHICTSERSVGITLSYSSCLPEMLQTQGSSAESHFSGTRGSKAVCTELLFTVRSSRSSRHDSVRS